MPVKPGRLHNVVLRLRSRAVCYKGARRCCTRVELTCRRVTAAIWPCVPEQRGLWTEVLEMGRITIEMIRKVRLQFES